MDGLELLRTIKREWPEVPVIMLSTHENAPFVKRALSDGASGYLLKDATPEDLAPGDRRGDLRRRQRPLAAGHPDPVRGSGVFEQERRRTSPSSVPLAGYT